MSWEAVTMSKASRLKGHCNRLMAIFELPAHQRNLPLVAVLHRGLKMCLCSLIVVLFGLGLLFSRLSQSMRVSSTAMPETACVVFASQEEAIHQFISDHVLAATKGRMVAHVLLAKLFSAFLSAMTSAPIFFSTPKTTTNSFGPDRHVGIGTTAPAANLSVYSTTAQDAFAVRANNGQTWRIDQFDDLISTIGPVVGLDTNIGTG